MSDPSTLLARLPRQRGEELRVELASYEGHQYISLRVWGVGIHGRPVPLKGKGCSVRLSEILPVARALAEAMRRTGRARDDRRDWRQAALPDGRGAAGFDEFA